MSTLGMADLGIANGTDMIRNAGMIVSLDPDIPLIADVDTGYDGTLDVAITVHQYARAGVAGLHNEDQGVVKRCGHLAGKTTISHEEYAKP
ncbi:related to carboxyphosphonoenolpyruvate phosphonomutase [Lecanosticta acicola]|uniref:methylisocitrate lyase n=1 Tax=Lecanosticta acicola TaxID=111012 RepID=A0AAI8YXN5_9PEZI|nr:related to carboxyphosphonoenolpyruvate phosphonomutase [Lecanosticta acicola]